MTTTVYRPTAPTASTLDEIVCDDFAQRFAACAAVERTVWDHGYRACRDSVERAAWHTQYRIHLEKLCIAWSYGP